MNTPETITALKTNEVFVFGSNAAGLHAAGAARTAAERFGAVWGRGEGLSGQSYALPTMEGQQAFRGAVARFLTFATDHPEMRFLVTRVGCGIAGYTPDQVGPWFAGAPSNVVLPYEFQQAIEGS